MDTIKKAGRPKTLLDMCVKKMEVLVGDKDVIYVDEIKSIMEELSDFSKEMLKKARKKLGYVWINDGYSARWERKQ